VEAAGVEFKTRIENREVADFSARTKIRKRQKHGVQVRIEYTDFLATPLEKSSN
jgi:hypothetical protein